MVREEPIRKTFLNKVNFELGLKGEDQGRRKRCPARGIEWVKESSLRLGPLCCFWDAKEVGGCRRRLRKGHNGSEVIQGCRSDTGPPLSGESTVS